VPQATRAVASAIARNPIACLIPCHRVIQSTGAFGEYHWGALRKKALHAFERSQPLRDGTPGPGARRRAGVTGQEIPSADML